MTDIPISTRSAMNVVTPLEHLLKAELAAKNSLLSSTMLRMQQQAQMQGMLEVASSKNMQPLALQVKVAEMVKMHMTQLAKERGVQLQALLQTFAPLLELALQQPDLNESREMLVQLYKNTVLVLEGESTPTAQTVQP